MLLLAMPRIFLVAALIIIAFTTPALADSDQGAVKIDLEVEITGVSNHNGNVRLALYSPPARCIVNQIHRNSGMKGHRRHDYGCRQRR